MPKKNSNESSLCALIESEALTIHFQPIVALGECTLVAHEALMRGPAGTPLQTPDALLAAARHAGLEYDLELLACRNAIAQFAARNAAGRLFLNMSAGVITRLARQQAAPLLTAATAVELGPLRLVIEVTEHERVEDLDELRDAVVRLRAMGLGLALDDFGDGRSSLRLWAELQPDIVKIDKYFVCTIQSDSRRVEVVKTMLRLADAFGTELVAEGVETQADLAVIRDLGCHYGQGYFIGRPQDVPFCGVPDETVHVLRTRKIAVLPDVPRRPDLAAQARRLVLDQPAVAPTTTNNELLDIFNAQPDLHAVAVVESDVPVGLINRRSFMDRYAQPYQRELYGRKSCTLFMNASPLQIETATPIDSLANVLTGSDQRYLYDGLILTESGRYAGIATGESLVRAVTEQRVEAARHANPLTFLPGNIPITQHIARLLASGCAFTAAYFDLTAFKPFNDLYGYWRGDEMIKLAARAITSRCDPLHDFVGHVGGDDFVALLQSDDWQNRVSEILAEFNTRALSLYDAGEIERRGIVGEDRHGNAAFFPITTLAAGAVLVTPGRFRSAEQVASSAAVAKRHAKALEGGLYVLAADESSERS
jgi:EAL domain-containing protein (putative c-di-GMP-specific phosphodiesterase class I)/GGDEF domain-containing protein